MINAAPSVSVILPTWLPSGGSMEGGWLEEAVASIAREASAAAGGVQLVLVDDGGTVDVAVAAEQILADSAAVHLTLCKGPRRGLVAALNCGLAAASAPWIARLDQDDVWLEGKLATQLAHLVSAPDDTLVFGGMRLLDEAGAGIGDVPRAFDWAGTLAAFQEGLCAPPHGTILGRRDVFRRLGGYAGDAEAVSCEDFHLWLRWARFFPVHGLDRLLLGYRRHPRSESQANTERQRLNSLGVTADAQALGDPVDYLAALAELAFLLGASASELGGTLHDLWRFGGWIAAPAAAAAPLTRVFYDRVSRPADRRRWPGYMISLF